MKSVSTAGLRLFFDAEECKSAELIAGACEKSVRLIRERWGLPVPADCRVYVMTSWPKFLFQAAPWSWKIMLAATFPFYAFRFHVIWPFAGGWSLTFGRRRAVGIKAAHLMHPDDVKPEETIYIQSRTQEEKAETVTCHELVHAFSAHLHLPGWLNEGLATLAMDTYLGRQLVREDTLDELANAPNYIPRGSERLRIENPRVLLYQYICGYWQTRYIEESRPGLLRDLFGRSLSRKEMEDAIAASYGKDPDAFWMGITGEVTAWFRKNEPGSKK